jgi:hypothetical protein
MTDKILLKRSLVSGSIPTTASLEVGELALNVHDATVYLKQSGSGQEVIRPLLTLDTDSTGDVLLTGSITTTEDVTAPNFIGNLIGTASLADASVLSESSSLALSVSGSSGRVLYNSADNTTTTSENLEFDGSNLTVGGQLNASTKSFVIKHRTLPDKKLVYGVSEGPEHSVFIRGKLEGTNKIILPSEWDWLVDLDSLSVQLTPIGKYQKLYVESVEGLVITIANDNLLSKSVNCYYLIQGTRKDVEPLQTVI